MPIKTRLAILVNTLILCGIVKLIHLLNRKIAGEYALYDKAQNYMEKLSRGNPDTLNGRFAHDFHLLAQRADERADDIRFEIRNAEANERERRERDYDAEYQAQQDMLPLPLLSEEMEYTAHV